MFKIKKKYFIFLLTMSVLLNFSCNNNVEPNELNSDQVENLAVICKIWGGLKYYHPEVREGKKQWDKELFQLIDTALLSKNKADRNKSLKTWVTTLNKKIDHFESKNQIEHLLELDWMKDSSEFGNDLMLELEKITSYNRESDLFYVNIDTASGRPEFVKEEVYSNVSFPNKKIQLLALFRYWNIIKYFYPYKENINGNWDEILLEFIPKFYNIRDSLSYRLVMLELISKIGDSHATIIGDKVLENYKGNRLVPAELSYVENQFVIVNLWGDDKFKVSKLEVGDILIKVDGKNINEIITESIERIPAANRSGKLWKLSMDLLRTNAESLSLTIKREGKQISIKEETYPRNEVGHFGRSLLYKSCFEEIGNKIAYVNMGSEENCDIPDLSKYQDLIIDLRSYPNGKLKGFPKRENLVDSATEFAFWTSPNIQNPGEFYLKGRLKVFPEPSKLSFKKIAVIVNENTISQAEFIAMFFNSLPNAFIIGNQTAGTDGDVVKIKLPDSLITSMSSLGIYYPNGSSTQGKGIKIDYRISPTINDIKSGKDRLKDYAINLLMFNTNE